MKKIVCALLLLPSLLLGQNITNEELAKEVDLQIWEPFKSSYAEGNAELFNSLHTDDVLRISKRGIRKGEAYKASNTKWLSNPDRKPRTIDFVFEHRIYADDTAYEIGYYKVAPPAGEEGMIHYARFTVLLRKENGTWRITQDWDTEEINGRKVTEEDFNRLKG